MASSALADIDQEAHITECLSAADELKSEGNNYFRSGRWDEALSAYKTGLGRLPNRKQLAINPENEDGSHNEEDVAKSTLEEVHENHDTNGENAEAKPTEYIPTELDISCSKARAILHANIGACYVKLNDHKNAVEACTQSLLDDPHYVKALERRAASNEIINTWSSLTTTQEDYMTLLQILPPSSPQLERIRQSLQRLKPRIEAAQKRETAEMMDKLKGLGNSLLNRFGLSTDNFKFEPNGQGGYSMNFSQ